MENENLEEKVWRLEAVVKLLASRVVDLNQDRMDLVTVVCDAMLATSDTSAHEYPKLDGATIRRLNSKLYGALKDLDAKALKSAMAYASIGATSYCPHPDSELYEVGQDSICLVCGDVFLHAAPEPSVPPELPEPVPVPDDTRAAFDAVMRSPKATRIRDPTMGVVPPYYGYVCPGCKGPIDTPKHFSTCLAKGEQKSYTQMAGEIKRLEHLFKDLVFGPS